MSRRHHCLCRRVVLLVAAVVCLPAAGFGQTITPAGMPVDRYSISPYLQDSFLFLHGTTLENAYRLDISLGMKYMRQPWRVYIQGDEDTVQAPVDDSFQIRPAVSFAYPRWFDLALVVPFSYQTAGDSATIFQVSGQDGTHFLDPELFIRVPFLHQRVGGLGLALATQLFIPVGTDQAYAGVKTWQGAVVLLALDWRSGGFAMGLNTGAILREHAYTDLDTPLEPEFLIRPGISYSFPAGSVNVGFAVEANIATSMYDFFNSENVDAFQLLASVGIQPARVNSGFYAAAGGGAGALESSGYSVPAAHFDGRLGYSLGWKVEEPLDEELLAEKPPREKEPGEVPGERESRQPAEVPPGEEPPPEVAVAEVPPEEAGREIPPAGEPTEVPPEEAVPEPKVATIFPEPIPAPAEKPVELPPGREVRDQAGRIQVARVDFMVDAPRALSPEQPMEYVDTDSEPALTTAAREHLRERKGLILAKLRETGGGLFLVGFSDKCYEGPPYLGTQYNRELTTRRVKAVARFLRKIMGPELSGVSIRMQPMGRRCANPLCRCDNPEMSQCAKDRRVEVYVETGAEKGFQCPEGEYWLVP